MQLAQEATLTAALNHTKSCSWCVLQATWSPRAAQHAGTTMSWLQTVGVGSEMVWAVSGHGHTEAKGSEWEWAESGRGQTVGVGSEWAWADSGHGQ